MAGSLWGPGLVSGSPEWSSVGETQPTGPGRPRHRPNDAVGRDPVRGGRMGASGQRGSFGAAPPWPPHPRAGPRPFRRRSALGAAPLGPRSDQFNCGGRAGLAPGGDRFRYEVPCPSRTETVVKMPGRVRRGRWDEVECVRCREPGYEVDRGCVQEKRSVAVPGGGEHEQETCVFRRTPPRPRHQAAPESAEEGGAMQVIHQRCAGLDVHKRTVVACVLRDPAGRERPVRSVRTFGTMTEDLPALSAGSGAAGRRRWPWRARACTCAVSRRVRSLPQGGRVRKETRGSTTYLAAKAKGDNSMSSKRGGPEGV